LILLCIKLLGKLYQRLLPAMESEAKAGSPSLVQYEMSLKPEGAPFMMGG
jgi:hypothetical protein